ncbi:MAG TPA: segregation/condensation protein A [Pseudomonadales bacterium]|nr:segregation/condensation protein A [Pseudomonadales bacterium]|tara:strand:- start:15470 stop:16342 length:873 start_codon:yes stop_codon:yes gene_type:complete
MSNIADESGQSGDDVSIKPIVETEPDDRVVAIVRGQVVEQLPDDLYIPPDALEVVLEAFEGPLDLLLYLIRRQNLDVLEIRVAEITHQYMQYIELMSVLQLELAGEYLVMAAMLAEIKSRMLLPRESDVDVDETDPRAELIRRLQEYEVFKEAAANIDAMPRIERDVHVATVEKPELVRAQLDPGVDFRELAIALAEVLNRVELYKRHSITAEPLSVRERMSKILDQIAGVSGFLNFPELFELEEGRKGVIVTFLALLELMREGLVDVSQNEPYSPIYVLIGSEVIEDKE